jgi:hypothetical protein
VDPPAPLDYPIFVEQAPIINIEKRMEMKSSKSTKENKKAAIGA